MVTNVLPPFYGSQCTWLTNVRWASEPDAFVQYFSVVGGVGITAVVSADGVLLTSSHK